MDNVITIDRTVLWFYRLFDVLNFPIAFITVIDLSPFLDIAFGCNMVKMR
jgi:hypothetical protein